MSQSDTTGNSGWSNKQVSDTATIFDRFSHTEIADINKYATKLSQYFEGTPCKHTRGDFAHTLAKRAAEGRDLFDAFFEIKTKVTRNEDVIQPISTISDKYQDTASVAGQVICTACVATGSKNPFVIIADDSGEAMQISIHGEMDEYPTKGDKIEARKCKITPYQSFKGEKKIGLTVVSEHLTTTE